MYGSEMDQMLILMEGIISGLGILTYILFILALLIPYIVMGYMIMCIGRKAHLRDDWMPFVPIARQLYQMQIADCPWWYIFLFGNTFVTGAITVLIGLLFGAVFEKIALVILFWVLYWIAVLVFTFLYYRRYYACFGFNPNTAWIEIIWAFGFVATVLLVLVAFSDSIRYRGNGEEPFLGYDGPSGRPEIERREPAPVREDGRKASIRGISGKYAEAVFDLNDGAEVVFGRSASEANIVFDQFETDISRKHCSVSYHASSNQFVVTDFSTNGTYGENGLVFTPNLPTSVPVGTVIYLGKNKKNSFRLG